MNNTVIVVFSKNRPMQLDLTLRSFQNYCQDNPKTYDMFVLWTADPEYQSAYFYLDYMNKDKCLFYKERNFKDDLLWFVEDYKFVMFIVDDCVWVNNFSISDTEDLLEELPQNIGFSYRLGKNTNYCYAHNRSQKVPEFKKIYYGKNQDILEYDWIKEELDFQYPIDFSSSIFKIEYLLPLLRDGIYGNPNDCEWLAYCNLNYFARWPSLLSYETSVAFCNPVNKVQNVNNNRMGNLFYYSPEELLEKFMDGWRIDLSKFEDFVSNAVHQEVEFEFVKEKDV